MLVLERWKRNLEVQQARARGEKPPLPSLDTLLRGGWVGQVAAGLLHGVPVAREVSRAADNYASSHPPNEVRDTLLPPLGGIVGVGLQLGESGRERVEDLARDLREDLDIESDAWSRLLARGIMSGGGWLLGKAIAKWLNDHQPPQGGYRGG